MNEYYDHFKNLQRKDSFQAEQWFGERKKLVEAYCWAIPNEDVINYIARFNDIVSVGSGKAYWEHLLEQEEVDVLATDRTPPDDAFTDVQKGWADTVVEKNDVVLMIWPPNNNLMARDVLLERPSDVLYVGEWRNGCTASKSFFDELESNYARLETIDLPSYKGVRDNFYHYGRKT